MINAIAMGGKFNSKNSETNNPQSDLRTGIRQLSVNVSQIIREFSNQTGNQKFGKKPKQYNGCFPGNFLGYQQNKA